MLLGISISVQAHTLSPDQYLIWGLDSQDVQIPVGSVITEAVLTIHDFVPSKARFNLHLLDNTAVGVQLGVKEQPGNIFDGFGTLLTGNASGGKWICRLSQINPANSPMRTIFGDSFKMTLSNGSEVSFSSGLLELMDYIGNGGGFGLGFSFTDVCTFSQITLDIFAKSHAGGYQEKVYSFQISQMYVYDPVSGTWVYQGGDGQSEWEIQEDDPYVPLTVTNCQVIAGETIGQDTLTISGTFDRVLSNLPQSSAIKTEIISFSDNTVIYSQDCNCSRDTVYNRFIWNYELPENQPGQITTLVVDFANRTFEVVATRVDLSGLSSPIQINLLVGSYLMTGQVDETIINGDELIPLRLMRGYQDQLRVTEVAVNKGQTPGTDTLTVCGEITTDNPGINLTNQKVIINWGDQPFVIPIGSFIQTKNLNKYACKVDVPGGFVDCLIDFDRCLFTINLSKASLDVASGRVKFMIRFAQFKQFEYVQM